MPSSVWTTCSPAPSTTSHISFGREDFRFIKQDVTEYLYLEGPVDYVFHFASPASPVDYLRYPIQTLKVGSLGTHKALGLAKAKGARFLLASTSEVYGDPLVHPQPEAYWGNVNPVGPRGVYDEAKRFAEALTMAYHRDHGVDTRIVRIFNTYGPRMRPDDGRVVSELHGPGPGRPAPHRLRRRVADPQLLLRVRPGGRPGPAPLLPESDPVNLGNPTEFTIRDLVTTLETLLGRSLPETVHPLPTDDPQVRQPDITRARTLLGWEPTVDLATGLRETLGYFEKQLAAGGGLQGTSWQRVAVGQR